MLLSCGVGARTLVVLYCNPCLTIDYGFSCAWMPLPRRYHVVYLNLKQVNHDLLFFEVHKLTHYFTTGVNGSIFALVVDEELSFGMSRGIVVSMHV